MKECVAISPTLAHMAERFDIDLSSLAEQALRDRILAEPTTALTARMTTALLTARQEGRRLGHSHIGCEHVFLGILLDKHSIPAQILQDMGVGEDVVQRIQTMLASDGYNRRVGGDRN
jgi:ATP-dependent Clp protease ATP-binding subunit ClpA